MTGKTKDTAAVEQFLSGRLAQVDVNGIIKELKQLWSAVNDGVPGQEHTAIARACVLNLILYSGDLDAEAACGHLLDEISVEHPCRALLAIARPSEDLRLEAWVSARCHLSSTVNHRQICCEQITVRWEGSGTQELPSVVVPLLVPDLPVFLWWRTSSFTRNAVEPFINSVDKLVVDSSRWGCQLGTFKEWARYVAEHRQRLMVSDLSWLRIQPYRCALARSFDEFLLGLNLEQQNTIEQVSLQCAPNSFYEPLHLLSWLASRLDWQPVNAVLTGETRGQIEFKSKTCKVLTNWQLVPELSTGFSAINKLELRLADGSLLTMQLDLKDVSLTVESHIGPQVKRTVINSQFSSEAALMGRELAVLEKDPIYEATVGMISRIISLS